MKQEKNKNRTLIVALLLIAVALLALIGACAAKKNHVAKDEPVASASESEESTSVSSAPEEKTEEKAEEKNVPKSGTLETPAAQTSKLSEADRIAIAKRALALAKEGKEDEEKTENVEEKAEEKAEKTPEEVVPNSGTQTPAPATPVTTAQESATPAHTHTWTEQTTTVHHDEVGHTETVVVSEAWDEEVPVYEDVMISRCSTCGEYIGYLPEDEFIMHLINHNASAQNVWDTKQVGTNTVHHDAITEERYVVDQAAYDETVVTGYVCSECGATQ